MNRVESLFWQGRFSTPVTLSVVLVALSALATACGVEVEGDEPVLNQLFWPVGAAIDPSGTHLYVVNSNFDLRYRDDRGGTVVAVDTDTLSIVPNSAAQIGTFGGDIKLNNVDGEPTRAYVAVRGDRSVTVLDIESGGTRLRCLGGRLTERCRLGTSESDPFGLAVSTFPADVIGGGEEPVDFVAVAHLGGSDVTAFSVRGQERARSFSTVSAPLVAGANAIAQSPRNSQFYVTSRFTNTVVSFRPSIDPDGDLVALFETDEIAIENASPLSGLDSRGIAFNSDGTYAYVANRGPDSLVIIDVGPTNPDTGGGTRNQIVDYVPLPNDPAEVVIATIDGRDLVYVSSYDDESISVVDPDTRIVIDTIPTPGQPYTLVIDQVRHQRMYVTLFNEDAVAVIDLDPESPSFNQVAAVIR